MLRFLGPQSRTRLSAELTEVAPVHTAQGRQCSKCFTRLNSLVLTGALGRHYDYPHCFLGTKEVKKRAQDQPGAVEAVPSWSLSS